VVPVHDVVCPLLRSAEREQGLAGHRAEDLVRVVIQHMKEAPRGRVHVCRDERLLATTGRTLHLNQILPLDSLRLDASVKTYNHWAEQLNE
jgi:hypothetical protein